MSALLGGIVDGEVLHVVCATDAELKLSWSAYFARSTLTREKAALPCVRCGQPIGKAPRSERP